MKIYRIICENAAEEDEKIYFSLFYGNGLYSYDKRTKRAKRLGTFPEQPLNKLRLYENILKINRLIIALPSYGEAIISIYNLDTGKFDVLDLRPYIDDLEISNLKYKFSDCIVYKEYLYVIGYTYPAIIKININTYSIEYIDTWISEVYEKDMSAYLLNGIVKENIAYLPLVQTAGFLKLDLQNGATEIIKAKSSIKYFSGVVEGIANDMWLLATYEPTMINVNVYGEVLEEVKLFEISEDNGSKMLTENPVRVGNGCYLFPVCAEHVYFFNYETKMCEICYEFEDVMQREMQDMSKANRRVYSFQTRENFVYLVELGAKLWHEIDLRTRQINTFNVLQDISSIVDRFKRGIVENEKDILADLLEYIKIDQEADIK